MSAISQLSRQAWQAMRCAVLMPRSAQLASARTFVYHRSSKTPRSRVSDFDDGYHYRNGELHYAQTLRHKQEATLRFDQFLQHFTKKAKTQSNWTANYPNCNCLTELREMEKHKPANPRPETACAVHEYAVSYYDM